MLREERPQVSFYLLQNTCCCGLFCHKQYQFIRHAIRVVGLYTNVANPHCKYNNNLQYSKYPNHIFFLNKTLSFATTYGGNVISHQETNKATTMAVTLVTELQNFSCPHPEFVSRSFFSAKPTFLLSSIHQNPDIPLKHHPSEPHQIKQSLSKIAVNERAVHNSTEIMPKQRTLSP